MVIDVLLKPAVLGKEFLDGLLRRRRRAAVQKVVDGEEMTIMPNRSPRLRRS